ncbi:dihydrofolate reductase family protein [Mucilaginibacter terrae]|uniref:dihydrofolate reductase family protein n=1 Tax=Mucilaginibacter terrae TaxID=1955052 RepID=UPI00363A824B
MRKVVLNLAVSLDGFIEGPNGEYDWCLTDQDYGMTEFFTNVDTIFIGRRSYEMIAGAEDEYFPTIKKIYVFSDTLAPVENHKVEIINSVEFDSKVNTILNANGANIWLFGGAGLTATMFAKRLVSGMLLSVHPVILGGGKPLFRDIQNKVELLLEDTKPYDTGLVQLKYVLKPIFENINVLDTQAVDNI